MAQGRCPARSTLLPHYSWRLKHLHRALAEQQEGVIAERHKVRVCTQVDLTHAVGKFLVEQARGSTHAPASSQEEDALLIYNYQTTFTGKVGLQAIIWHHRSNATLAWRIGTILAGASSEPTWCADLQDHRHIHSTEKALTLLHGHRPADLVVLEFRCAFERSVAVQGNPSHPESESDFDECYFFDRFSGNGAEVKPASL